MFFTDKNALLYECDNSYIRIEPYGENVLRVRARRDNNFGERSYALLPVDEVKACINIGEKSAEIINGKARATIEESGKICFFNDRGEKLLEEYYVPKPLKKKGHEFWEIGNGKYRINLRFFANEGEKIFGMGQYQQPFLDLKGSIIELSHRNSQASVPFYISSLGYGFIWHMPSIGEVHFGRNITK
jgi:alpha-D-xyloside xylohydrolase